MTEYWQSQAKKFCDFCKCWLTDNKPSISFHENGKKHKENVERRIKEVRKRGVQVRKDDDELKRNLQAIETAALEAYKKDVGIDNVSTTMPSTVNNKPTDQWKPSSSTSTSTEPTNTGCSITYTDGQPVVRCIHCWSIAQSDQGYYYYYNSQSQVTQWEVPQCLQAEDGEDKTAQIAKTTESTTEEKKETVGETKNSSDEENPPKEEEKIENENLVISHSPYGAWTTVRTIEAPSITKETLARLQQDKTEQSTQEDPEVTAKNTEKKFKERETPKLSGHNTDEVVPFKKRKLNSERKRNIRQTKVNT